MRLFSQQWGTNYYKMTFGIISGELFIVEEIASETCQQHPKDSSKNSTQRFQHGHENEVSRWMKLSEKMRWLQRVDKDKRRNVAHHKVD